MSYGSSTVPTRPFLWVQYRLLILFSKSVKGKKCSLSYTVILLPCTIALILKYIILTLFRICDWKAVMTRWARANNVHKQKPAEATPWSQLKASRGAGKQGSAGSSTCHKQDPQNDRLRRTQPGGSAVKKPNRKKKEYVDEDVNGFLAYLQQTGQSLPKESKKGGDEKQGFREELETALKKDRRREDRRLKRQNVKKRNMVSSLSAHISFCLPSNELFTHFVFSFVLTAGSLVTAWPTVRRPTEMRRWAEASATGVALQSTKSRSAKLKWTLLWVRSSLGPT